MSNRRPRRSLIPILLAVVALVANVVVPAPATGAGPDLRGPAPMPTRDGAAKGGGTAPGPELTGRLIVRYAAGVTAADRDRLRAAQGLALAERSSLERTEVVTPAAGATRAMSLLARAPEIEWVEPERRMRLFAGPTTEPLFGQQWGLHNTGQVVNGFTGVPDVDMNVPEAWAVTQGSADVVVAVIDSGVDIAHPDLADRIWTNPGEIPGNGIDDDGNGFVDDVHGWDFCDEDSTVFDPDQAHGTHVAGTIAASGNGIGVAGVAPKVTIMPVRFINDDDDVCGTDSQAADAITYAVENGAHIVNASWGGYGVSAPIRDAIAAAPQTLFVAAAGNEDLNTDVSPVSPASLDLPNILSVAAIHNEGYLTDFTNYGPSTVDVVVPGEDIVSTLPGGHYGLGSGTSMAAPHATGVAALVASVQPSFRTSPGSLIGRLITTGRAMPSVRGWVAHARLIDARLAVLGRAEVVRVSGADRYATAGAISKSTFVPRVPYVFVATGRDFPDALAGSALAAQLGAPVLLVSTSSVPAPTVNELRRLKPTHIYVLGGAAAVSNAVVAQLAAHDDLASSGPYRIAGADRYATAAAISFAGFDPGVPTAFIATGANFPDALAAAPVSAERGGPLLLVSRTQIPAATKQELARLRPGRIVVLGGPAVVSDGVVSQLAGYAPSVTRLFGADRYATAAAASKGTFGAPVASAFVASGQNFPDALAGGPSAGAWAGPLLLVQRQGVPAATRSELARLRPLRIFVLGGPAVVSDVVVSQLRSIAQ